MPFFENKEIEFNSIELACQARKAKGLPLIDLTCSNPTLQEYFFPKEILKIEIDKYLSNRIYIPESKGLLKARKSIAKYYIERGLNISAEHIIITANTSESYSFLFSLLCEVGDNVLVPNVTYPLFDFLAEYQKIKTKNYFFKEKENLWDINYSSILDKQDSRTKALMLISPHNPLGHIITERKEEIIESNLPLICDEVFAEFVNDKKNLKPIGELYPEIPVFHLNGISKMFALPDMKLGWIALNDAALEKYSERLELLNDMFLSANTMVQTALPAIFGYGVEFKDEMVESVNKKLNSAIKIINSSHCLNVNLPQGGYHLFPKIINQNLNEEKIILKLIDHGILVHPGYFYGSISTPSIVISCLVREDKLYEGLETIIRVLEE